MNFRWLDSGDLQGENHFRNIITVAENTPAVRHWLPTREIETVKACEDEIPQNLVVRVSAHRIDSDPPKGFPNTSTVIATRPPGTGYVCPSPDQGNECGECEACWEPKKRNVQYWLH